MIVMIWTGGFSVAFDPLDGSSIVDTNFSVGTIFGVWPGDKLTGVTGRDQVAAAMGVYGPRTTYVLALKDYPGTHEFLLLDEGVASIQSSNNHPRQGAPFYTVMIISYSVQQCFTFLPCSVVLLYTEEKSRFTSYWVPKSTHFSLKEFICFIFQENGNMSKRQQRLVKGNFSPLEIWEPHLTTLTMKRFLFSLFYWKEEEEMFR